jgi:hypothetical protein
VLRVRDASGNTADTTVGVTFTVTGCLVNLIGLPAGAWLNASLCSDGIACASTTLTVQGEFIGPCGAVTELRLLDGGGPDRDDAAHGLGRDL